MQNPFETPILLLIYNRPKYTRQVFKQISYIKPRYLFIAADGPLDGDNECNKLCDQAREVVKLIDWECNVKTLFRDNNLGCKEAVFQAVSWFFRYTDQGIILEDDCKPDLSFFLFSQLLLKRYKKQKNIKAISGTNYFFGKLNYRNSYFFSPFIPIWGWATWKDRWQEVIYKIDKKQLDIIKNRLSGLYNNPSFEKWLYGIIKGGANGEINSWDPFFAATYILNEGISITPYRNLISNIGISGTHTDNNLILPLSVNMNTKSINLSKLIHPSKIKINRKALKLTITGVNKVNCVPSDALGIKFYKKIKRLIWS